MNTVLIGIAGAAIAYLVGSIPTAYLLVRAVKGIDIRTVGSGNVGATNAGRELGMWAFWLVFALDLAKGFLPTWGIPRVIESLNQPVVPGLPVALAVGAILGHNFPVFLGLKGGKGVATSLGAMIALDPIASVAAAMGFVVTLAVTRYVSIASILAAVVFLLAHSGVVMNQGRQIWQPEELPMTLACLALFCLLVYRHRGNLARIAAGTEPKIRTRPRRPSSPPGRVRVGLILAFVTAALAAGILVAVAACRPSVLELDESRALVVTDRVSTGQQRADALAFGDEGRRLVVLCPRYRAVVIYRIDDPGRLVEERVVTVDGRPVAIAVSGALAYILERPAGDARHIEPGFWQCLDLTTGALGPRARVGWDPDDLALLPGGRHVAVLLSGHAEGESNRPPPSLEIFELSSDPALPARIASLPFEQPGEDPARLTLSRTGQAAVVTIRGTNMSASIDLTDPTSPRLLGRFPLPALEVDYLSYDSTASSTDEILMPVASEQDAVLFRPAAEIPGEWVLSAREADSAVWVYPTRDRRALGRLPLRGAMNFGEVRPTAIAVEPRRGYFAVASRSGAVHLVALRATSPDASSSVALARDEPSHDHSRR